MDSRKICILGDFAVGKTSLVRRFVHNQFNDRYLTTIGVKIDTKLVARPERGPLKLAIWDLAGTGTPTGLFLRYCQGAAGYLLVADAGRGETLSCCRDLRAAVADRFGPLPYVALVNKSDLGPAREIDAAAARADLADALDWLDTSAATGDNVEQAFQTLAAALAPSR